MSSEALESANAADPGGDYTSLSRGWSDKLQQAEARGKTQSALIALLSLALVIVSLAAIYFAAFRQPLPYVLRVDEVNGVSFGGYLEGGFEGGEELTPSQLMAFVEHWRTVTPDNTQQKRYVTRLYCMASVNAPARDALNDYFRTPANDPFVRNRNTSVSTEMRQVSRLAGATWQIEWYETLREHDGMVSGERQTFRATMIVERGPVDRACIEANPLGLYVQDLSWVQVR